MSRISAIAAVGSNRAIGCDNKLPWNLPKDLERFRVVTRGHPIIMGRKTYVSIGRLLPGRTNIIITRDHSVSVPGAVVVHSLEDALARAQELDQSEIFIIGGAEIYDLALPKIDRLYLTEVDDAPQADAFFPDFSSFSKIISEEAGKENGISYVYRIHERP